MMRLLAIEWMKLKHYRAFKVFGILYLLGILGVLFVMNVVYSNIPATQITTGFLENPFDYPKLWNTTGWLNSWLLFFPGWLIINHCVNEFNFKTHRQNIIDGWSRKQFITAKLLLILAFAIVITLINILATVVMGLSLGASFSLEGFQFMGFVFIQTLNYMLFAFLLAILLRKSGLAAGIFFLFGLIFEIIIVQLINRKFNLAPAGFFLPLQVSDELVPLPFLEKVLNIRTPAIWALLVGCVSYCSLYVYIAIRKFKNDDL
jgi:ABC-type transport system involved in multi-copper enzyme maturation permease subunit